jgi:hypothetical protein
LKKPIWICVHESTSSSLYQTHQLSMFLPVIVITRVCLHVEDMKGSAQNMDSY